MKILAFTDIHGSKSALRKLNQIARIRNPDALVCAGDITIFENNLSFCLRKINSIGKPVIIVHGNHEEPSSFNVNLKNIYFIHKKHFIIDGVLFLGYGGGGFSKVDNDFKKTGKKFGEILAKNKSKKAVFVTHAPPYKTRLDNIDGQHCGSKTLRQFAGKNKIGLWVCGHLHENFGKWDNIKNTRAVNPGKVGKIITI